MIELCVMSDSISKVSEDIANDFFKDLRSAIFQKIGTPLYISIISIFCIDNWDKLLFLAFSSKSIELRIWTLQHDIPFTWWPCVVLGVLFTILMPYVTRLLELSQYYANAWRLDISSRSDIASLRSIDKTNREKHRSDIRDEKRKKRKIEYTKRCDELIIKVKNLEVKSTFFTSTWDIQKGYYDHYSSSLTSCMIDLKEANQNLSDIKKEMENLSSYISNIIDTDKRSSDDWIIEVSEDFISRIVELHQIIINNSIDAKFNNILIRDEQIKILDKKINEAKSKMSSDFI